MPKVCELGGGENPELHPNVDYRAMPSVDIVANLEEPLPLLSNDYDYVLSKFVIEHMSWRKVNGFIKEIHRILRVGGRVVIITANLKEQARLIATKEVWDGTESALVFGGQEYEGNYHKCGFSSELLVKLFREVGFSSVVAYPLPICLTDMILEGVK
jgi:predicted SAM-dependent methyltransferase